MKKFLFAAVLVGFIAIAAVAQQTPSQNKGTEKKSPKTTEALSKKDDQKTSGNKKTHRWHHGKHHGDKNAAKEGQGAAKHQ